jgi:signal transduction histidine kinase
MSFAFARDSFMVSNAAIGGCCAACGVLIVRHRPENRLGWLLLGAGVAQTATAAVTPWFVLGLTTDAPSGLVRWLSTAYSVAWPWSIAVFIPLALLHFPDGVLPGRVWRLVALLAVVNAPLQVLLFSSDVNPLATVTGLVVPPDGRSASWLLMPELARSDRLPLLSNALLAGAFAAALVLLVLRYRRGDERTRRQLLERGDLHTATELSDELQDSRRAIVTAREEERRRLRRELHDGLGPTLNRIAIQADAVVNLAERDPGQVRDLGEDMRASVTAAIQDVRELIYQLRPVALDELGLVDALHRHAQRLDRRVDGVALTIAVTAPAHLPELPAAVELAAYRIATEALTNVVRHSRASHAAVGVDLDGGAMLRITVQDDGCPDENGPPHWRPGVGLQSMRERAVELGGTFVAEPTLAGGLVRAQLPQGAST